MRLKTLCLAALILAVVCVTPASALEYTMDAPDDYLFARPTSDTTIYEHEDPNVDRANTALIQLPPRLRLSPDPNLVPGAWTAAVWSITYPAVDTLRLDRDYRHRLDGCDQRSLLLRRAPGSKFPPSVLSVQVYEGTAARP